MIGGVKAHGAAVQLIEQKVKAALEVADRVAFIASGSIRHAAPKLSPQRPSGERAVPGFLETSRGATRQFYCSLRMRAVSGAEDRARRKHP